MVAFLILIGLSNGITLVVASFAQPSNSKRCSLPVSSTKTRFPFLRRPLAPSWRGTYSNRVTSSGCLKVTVPDSPIARRSHGVCHNVPVSPSKAYQNSSPSWAGASTDSISSHPGLVRLTCKASLAACTAATSLFASSTLMSSSASVKAKMAFL